MSTNKRTAVDDLFDSLPQEEDPDKLFDSLPAEAPGWSAHGAALGESERIQAAQEMPSTRRDRASDFSGAGSALMGAGQGTTLGFGEELGAAIAAPFSSPSEEQKRDWADTGARPSFKEWLVANYEKERSQGRRSRDMAADQNPAEYGLGNVAGGFATGVVLDGLTGGAASTPLGNAAQGTLTGIGSSDAPLFSGGTALSAGVGGALGFGFGKAAKVAPVKTSLVGAGLGGAAAMFGDKIGMSKADRVGAGIGGGLAAGSAAIQGAAKAGNFLGKKSGQIADEARGVVQKGIEAADDVAGRAMDKENAASKAAGMKLFDAKEAELIAQDSIPLKPPENEKRFLDGKSVAPTHGKEFMDNEHKAAFKKRRKDEKVFERALRKAGKDKMAKFEETISGRMDAERAIDEGVIETSRQQARAIKDAAASASAEGTDPHARALSELGHKAKDFYARVRTQLGMGADLDADTLDALKILQPDFEAQTRELAGEFKGGKAALMDQLVAKYEAEASRPRPKLAGPDTDIRVPSADELLGTHDGPRAFQQKPESERLVPMPERKRLAQKAGLVPVRQPEVNPNEKYSHKQEMWHRDAEVTREKARLKAVNKLLGFEEADPGESLDPSVLITDQDERAAIARNAGVKGLQRSTEEDLQLAAANKRRRIAEGFEPEPEPKAKKAKPKYDPKALTGPGTRRPDVEAGSNVVDEWPAEPLGHEPLSLPRVFPGWPRWDQISSPDAPLVPEAQVHQYFKQRQMMPNDDADFGFGGPPKSGRPVGDIDQMLMSERVNEKVDAAKIRPSPTNAVRALINPKGAAVGALSSLVSGGDPAAKAKLYSAAQRALSTDPLLQEKYGALFANATVRADLPAILAAFPDLAKAVMAAASQEEQ